MLHFSPRFEVEDKPAHLKINIKTPAGAALNRVFLYNDGTNDVGDFTELEIHEKILDETIGKDTEVSDYDVTADDWITENQPMKDWAEFEAKFKGYLITKKIEFRFPPDPGSIGDLDPVVSRLENLVLKSFCKMLGLSDKPADANYYGKADAQAYKDIVNACVNNNIQNLTISRP